MRKYIICIVSFIGAALLQTGCYDDKGDYVYYGCMPTCVG